MKTWVRKTLSVGVLAAGALLFSSTSAHAGGGVWQDTQQNYGLGNGIQGAVPVNLGANACGNSASILGLSNAQAACGNMFESGPHSQKSKKNYGALNGLQVLVPIDGGANVTGNAATVGGLANAAGASANHFGGKGKQENAPVEKKDGNPTQQSSGNHGLLNGWQLYAPVNVGANVCGNSASVLGLSNAQAACWNVFGGPGKGKKESGVNQVTYDNYGALNALQIAAPINGMANVTGNAVSVAGLANASGASQNHTENGGGDGVAQDSHGNVGALNGAQIAAPVDLGINLCGNSVGVLGAANSAAGCGNSFAGDSDGHHPGDNGGDNGGDHDGDHEPDGDTDGEFDPDAGTDNNYGDAPRVTGDSAEKASPVQGVTDGLKTNNAGVGGLTGGLLKTLG
jgi:hypothetical protein